MRSLISRKSTLLVLILALMFTMGNTDCGKPKPGQTQPTVEERLFRASAAIPGTLKLVFPFINPTAMSLIESGVGAFQTLYQNPTLSAYEKAIKIWREQARVELVKLGSKAVGLVAGIDFLLTQISVPSAESDSQVVTLNLKKEAVEKIEKALEDLKKEAGK